jgi:hypothetical protein
MYVNSGELGPSRLHLVSRLSNLLEYYDIACLDCRRFINLYDM